MMNRIVVATDFSPASNRAFRFSLQLAKQLNAQIIAVFVKNADDLAIALRENIRVVRRDTQLKHQVQHFIQRKFQLLLRNIVDTPQVQLVIAKGTPWKEILKVSKKKRADLIVTGTRSRSSVSRLLLGSTAQKLILHSTCPVVTLRA